MGIVKRVSKRQLWSSLDQNTRELLIAMKKEGLRVVRIENKQKVWEKARLSDYQVKMNADNE